MIICFSGTGNSRYCADFIADKIGDEVLNAKEPIKNNTYEALVSEKPWVFVSPTYAWQIPHIFKDFIKKTNFSGSKDSYFIMTCGSDIGNASSLNEKICAVKGFNYKGTAEIIMPENYIALFDAPNEEDTIKIIRKAHPSLKKAVEKIKSGENIPDKKIGMSDKLKSGIINKGFYKFYVKADKFMASDKCTGCGKCAKVCPLNNICIDNEKPLWGKDCTHCMACICSCPVSAIEYGKISVGKPRYNCPEYKKVDINEKRKS